MKDSRLRDPFSAVASAARRIEQAEDREQRRFSAARRSGDGDIFAISDIKVNAGERVGFHFVSEKHFRHVAVSE